MAGVPPQPPSALTSARSSPAVNGNGSANVDYVNGHGALPDSPASAVPPPAATTKKGKPAANQKPQDDKKKTEKLLAARINELEQNTKGDKEQEAEIGMSCHFLPVWQGCGRCFIQSDGATRTTEGPISYAGYRSPTASVRFSKLSKCHIKLHMLYSVSILSSE